MSLSERQQKIIERLRPKSIHHGQLDAFLIAVPLSESTVSPERLEFLKNSLKAQGSNLVPLIVRRSEAYEDEEYEVVYGADWVVAAKAIDVEKLWVWVFDLTDEQAVAIRTEMQELIGSFEPSSSSGRDNIQLDKEIEKLLDQKLQSLTASINKLASSSSNQPSSVTKDRLEQLDSRVNRLTSVIERLVESVDRLMPKPINLLEAHPDEIDDKLIDAGVSDKQRKAALKAIEQWKSSSEGLTWSNLKQSTQTGSPHKVKDFGGNTYTKLKRVSFIPTATIS